MGLVKNLATTALAASTTINAQAPSVPQYVLDNAPLVKLTSGDPFLPSDIGAQLQNTHPQLNSTNVTDASLPTPLTLSNLDSLNTVPDSSNGSDIYLASNADFAATPTPQYLLGVAPDSTGTTQDAVSCAVITYDHADAAGTLDAFYMYFYAYNRGNVVLDNELGDHIGDWEHNMVRFVNGTPSAIWYSQHDNGEAFDWAAAGLLFNGTRPYAYSANGSHANYATAGNHDHTIPDVPSEVGLLIDVTDDAGYLWDPVKSAYFYTVTFPDGAEEANSTEATFTAANAGVDAGSAPTQWLQYTGQWGDDQLPSSDPRQSEFFGFYKYTAGPTGPRDKDLNRSNVCPKNSYACIVRSIVTPGG